MLLDLSLQPNATMMTASRTRFAAAFAAATLAAALPAAAEPQITVPDGFKVTIFADKLESIRGLAVSPAGDVYGRSRKNGVVALRDADGDGVADKIETMPGKIADGSGIGVHDGFLYYSTNTAVYRVPLPSGSLLPAGSPQTIVKGLGDRGQHNSKMFTFDGDGHIYVEVGSPSNSLGEPDRAPGAKGKNESEVAAFLAEFGGIWRFDANKPNQAQDDGQRFSTGHRHILSLAWSPQANALFGAQNGRDVINVVSPLFDVAYNAEHVAEEFHLLAEGANLGWPYTYFDPITHKRLISPEYGGDGERQPELGRFPDPLIAFPAHWAPMQMAYYGGEQFPERYRHGFFVAFHGSWNRAPEQKGYNVCFVPVDAKGMPTGKWEIFADGFIGKESIVSPGEADFRPMGVAVGPGGSLYIGSDKDSRLWKVTYAGE